MSMAVEISSALVLRIMRSVWIASDKDGVIGPPWEKCGILRGRGGRITVADWTENVSETPRTAFEIAPAQLLAAYKQARKPRALELLGFFHTHLSGSAWPSERDASSAAPDGKLWLIATELQARLWRAVPEGKVLGRFDPVRFDLKVGNRVEKDRLEVQHVDFGRSPEDFVITMEPPL